MAKGFVIDTLHAVYLGVTLRLLSYWFGVQHGRQDYSIHSKVIFHLLFMYTCMYVCVCIIIYLVPVSVQIWTGRFAHIDCDLLLLPLQGLNT